MKKHNIIILTALISVSAACTDPGSSDSGETTVNNYQLNATGQTFSYDNNGNTISGLSAGDSLYGQDADYLKGCEMDFSNNGDGTITDRNTGLMWEEVPLPDGMTWPEAVQYCEDLELAGYDDWRLPNIKELFSISNFETGWPYLDTSYFKLAGSVIDKSEQYWSENLYAGVTVEGQGNAAFGVNHVTGHIKAYPAGEDMIMNPEDGSQPAGNMPPPPVGDSPPPAGSPLEKHVRAVRGDTYGINEFTVNGDGTVSDASTGLMWTQADNGEGLDWQDALSYAENADIGGYADWRLPNVKELQSIVDYNYAPDAKDASFDGPAIDPLFSCTPVVNEAGVSDYAYYWTATSARFAGSDPFYYAWYVSFGRAVNEAGEDFHGAGAVRFDTKHENGPLGEGGERFYNYVRLVRDM